MKLSTLILAALPALAASEQIPLMDQAKGWFEKGKAYAQAALDSATAAPLRSTAAKIADKTVYTLHDNDWKATLKHSGKVTPYNSPEAWMIYFTGGNKTCYGSCYNADVAWNESVALFAADISAPHLAIANCETDERLCGSIMVDIPSIAVFIVPQPLPDQSAGPTDIYFFPLNSTTVTSADITKIHTRKLYLNMKPYDGILHPFDGVLAKLGVLEPLTQFLYLFGQIPSWAVMIGVSFFSRSFMSRRLQPQTRPGAAPAAAAAR